MTKLNAQIRNTFGKKNQALRKSGFIPAILYGHKTKNISLQIPHKDFEKVFEEAGQTTLVDLKIENENPKKVLIQEVQIDPISGDAIHTDLYQVKMTEKIKTDVPISAEGESAAVKDLEGSLILQKATVETETFPQDLIHEIKIDISSLKTFEDRILVSDLKVPETITILDNPDEVVAMVMPPRSEEELAELEEKVEEKVEEVEVEAEAEKGEETEVAAGTEEAQGEKTATPATPTPAPENPENNNPR